MLALSRYFIFGFMITSHYISRACGRSYRDLVIGEVGEISSPNYPEDYPANVSCTWQLNAPAFSVIELTCYDVKTQSCTPKNLQDYLLFNPDPAKDEYFL